MSIGYGTPNPLGWGGCQKSYEEKQVSKNINIIMKENYVEGEN